MTNYLKYTFFTALIAFIGFTLSCKSKKKMQQKNVVTVEVDTLGKCRIDYKNGKALTKYIKENELKYDWLFLKSNVTTLFEKEDKIAVEIKNQNWGLMPSFIELTDKDLDAIYYFIENK